MADTLAWNTYAGQKAGRRRVNARGETTWFNWTQYPDHGPGAEVLGFGEGAVVVDLGCGKGGNLAHVAKLGARAVGVDISPVQLATVRERWGTLGLELHEDDALAHLVRREGEYDAVYSVFGGVWFTDPGAMLPAIHRALRPGGVLGFSHRPPLEGCYGPQASYIRRGEAEPLAVPRWDFEPDRWCELLAEHGFSAVEARIVPPPPENAAGTMLVRAEKH